ncbi:Retrovirus-related Pol polyprotein from transposon 17.6, partial [Mucuna pruriens]
MSANLVPRPNQIGQTELKSLTENSSSTPPPTEIKPLPNHLKYAYLDNEQQLPIIIADNLFVKCPKATQEGNWWKLSDLPGINPSICMHKILMEEEIKLIRQQQRRLNPTILDMVKKEVTKLFAVGIIYPILDSQWVSLVQVVPKKSGMTSISIASILHLAETESDKSLPRPYRLSFCRKQLGQLPRRVNILHLGFYIISLHTKSQLRHCVLEKNRPRVDYAINQLDELVPMRIQNSWRVCTNYRKLNQATRKDHFPLRFVDQVPKKLSRKSHYCFLDGFSRYMQIHIAPEDQHKTTFTCPFGTFAYSHMPFGLYNVPSTFQHCMINIFSDLLQNCMEVFMDDFTVYANSFDACQENLSKVLRRCIDTNLVLNFEKCHFMVTEGIVLGHLVSNRGIEVDKSKIDIITSLPNTISVREVRSFLGHAGFYKIFIKNVSKLALPLSRLLQKDVDFNFDQPCIEAFQELKNRLTSAPILQAPNWDLHIKTSTPWFADICNYVATSQFPPEASCLYKEKLQSDAKYYIWDDPYLWRLCSDKVIRRCIPETEINSVLQFCHTAPGGNHYGQTWIARKVLDCGLYWPTIFIDAHQFVSTYDKCQKARMAMNRRHEMPPITHLVL